MTKIAWFTPFGPASDIGSFSRTVVNAIDRAIVPPFSSIELVIERNGGTYRPHVPFRFTEEEPVSGEDRLNVFNIGNNRENHLAINSAALAEPGIVVIHDVIMHDYMVWHHLEHRRDRLAYCAELAAEGGVDALRDVIVDFSQSGPRKGRPPWEQPHFRQIPLLSSFIGHAHGVVVHSDFAAGIVEQLTEAPICRLFLPSDQKRVFADSEIAGWAERTAQSSPVTFTSFGHITRNKRIDAIIAAFARSELLRGSARLQIAGHARDEAYLQELRGLIADSGLDNVSIDVSVDNATLEAIKERTDVFVLLREPNTEGASGSLVEALNTGRPVVLLDSGAFAEVPDDACVKIASLAAIDELAAELEALAREPERRVALGREGRAFQAARTSRIYAREFLSFARDIAPSQRATSIARYPKQGGDASLVRLAAIVDPATLAMILCRVKYRRAPGSAIERALGQLLAATNRSRRAQLCRAFVLLSDQLAGTDKVSLSDSMLDGLQAIVLLLGPVVYAELFWQQADHVVFATKAELIMAFTLRGPIGTPVIEATHPGLETLPMPIGVDLAMSDGEGWPWRELSSWHKPEANGTWTRGRFGVFPLRLEQPTPNQGALTFKIMLRLLFDATALDSAKASVNGVAVPLACETLERGWALNLPLERNAGDEWLVVVDFGAAGRPIDRGNSVDQRCLGALVSAIAIEAVSSVTAEATPAAAGRHPHSERAG